MLITEEYRELNKQAHKDVTKFGTGLKFVDAAQAYVMSFNPKSILDYGCGKGGLQTAFDYPIHLYDPAVEKFNKTPEPADLVFCIAVLEHIERDCLDAVLQDLKRVTKKDIVMLIDLHPNSWSLADGTSPHRIIENQEWWMNVLAPYFEIDIVTFFKHPLGKNRIIVEARAIS